MKDGSKIRMPAVAWRRVVIGTGVSTVMMLALSGCFAGLISGELVELSWVNYAAVLILIVASFLGAAAALGLSGGIGDGMMAGAGFLLVLFAINAVLFECELGGLLPALLAVAGGCGAAVLLLGGQGRKPRRHRRKYAHR